VTERGENKQRRKMLNEKQKVEKGEIRKRKIGESMGGTNMRLFTTRSEEDS
jgi:hypothetical protein